jgi:hypothetical protein
MCSARDNVALPTLGFPIRASAGHRLFSASPRLIAAVHALHRLLVPRHPPCALTILTVIFYREKALRLPPGDTRYIGYCAVFKVREEANPPRDDPGHVVQRVAGSGPVSQNSTACGRLGRARELGRTPCQVRSTYLVAGRARRGRRGLRRVKDGDRTGVRCPLVEEGSLERR